LLPETFPGLKYPQNAFTDFPDPAVGSSQRSARPHSWIRGREWKEREGKRMEGKRGKGRTPNEVWLYTVTVLPTSSIPCMGAGVRTSLQYTFAVAPQIKNRKFYPQTIISVSRGHLFPNPTFRPQFSNCG